MKAGVFYHACEPGTAWLVRQPDGLIERWDLLIRCRQPEPTLHPVILDVPAAFTVAER